MPAQFYEPIYQSQVAAEKMSSLEAQATLQGRIETLTDEVHAYARQHACV